MWYLHVISRLYFKFSESNFALYSVNVLPAVENSRSLVAFVAKFL